MITDSGSFLTEYLLTGSPIIHLFSSESAERNETVKKYAPDIIELIILKKCIKLLMMF